VCRRCNAALTFQTSRVLLGFLAQQGAPTGGAQALPAASATPASPAKRRRTRMVAVGAGLGLVIAASAIPVFRSRSAEPAPKPLQVAAVQPAPAVPLAQPKDLLPPAWVERPFAIEGQEVLVVGHGSAANPEAALEQARAEAISRLVEEALSGLSGTPYYDFVRSRAEGDAQAEARAWATRRYLAQHGDRATPLRAQVEVRPKAEGVEVYAQYKLGASAFKEVVDSYRATASFRGLTVARVFPLMERARPAPELVVIDVQPRSPAAQAGIAVGDALVSLNGRRVESIPSFTQISGELDRGPSKTLSLALSADGTERTVHLPKARPGWNR
ncbi:MAG TPA: PDZ domain-containing protein, partial [Longimicrobium sp.]|nr:PDZ domain-containing protein [Longimicrobium sp.]